MKISNTGIPWFREHEYDAFRELFVDGDGLPETYQEWLKAANGIFNKFVSEGEPVVKAYLHLETFPEWCRSRGLEINSRARTRFASEFARKDID